LIVFIISGVAEILILAVALISMPIREQSKYILNLTPGCPVQIWERLQFLSATRLRSLLVTDYYEELRKPSA
jgi:hypothetical protein